MNLQTNWLKSVACCLAIVLPLVSAGCGNPQPEGTQPEDTLALASARSAKIGFVLPLGDENGRHARQGAEVALDELNQTYGDRLSLNGRWEDSRGEPVATGTRMEALASDESVLGVVGPINSGPATNAADVANRNQLVLISPLASTPVLAQPDDFFFRTFPSDAAEAHFAADFARNRLKVGRIVVLYIDAPYGQSLISAFVEAFEEIGGQVLDTIQYKGNTQTFGPFVDRVQSQSPEALYYVGYPPDIAEVLRELRSRKVAFPVLSAAIIADPSVATLAGENVEGVMFPFPSTYRTQHGTDKMIEFREDYRKKFGEDPSFVAAQAYDAVVMLGQAIITAQEDSQALPSRGQIREALEKMDELEGATGTFHLDVNGDAVRQFRMYRIQNGQMTPLDD